MAVRVRSLMHRLYVRPLGTRSARFARKGYELGCNIDLSTSTRLAAASGGSDSERAAPGYPQSCLRVRGWQLPPRALTPTASERAALV